MTEPARAQVKETSQGLSGDARYDITWCEALDCPAQCLASVFVGVSSRSPGKHFPLILVKAAAAAAALVQRRGHLYFWAGLHENDQGRGPRRAPWPMPDWDVSETGRPATATVRQ